MRNFSAAKVAKFYLKKSGITGKRNYELMNPARMVQLFNKCLLCLRPQDQELIETVNKLIIKLQTQTA